MAGAALSNRTTAIDAALNGAPIGALQIRVALLCAVIAMLDGFDTQAIAFVAPVIGQQWGVTPDKFGLIFSAGLLGIMVGQLTLGPLADRWGRRPVILLCTVMFGLFSLATAMADGWVALLALRFLTGIGLGGATPNLITLTCEVSPPRARATMITAMFAGFPLGAAVGGYISSLLIPAYGWQAVFLLGGAIPLLLMAILLPALPELPQFLHDSGRDPARLKRFLDAVAGADRPALADPTPQPKSAARTGYAALFEGRLKAVTIPLWIAFFNSLLMVYFLMSWLPTIARQTGLALDTAIISAVFLNLGGALGGIVLGRLADSFGAFRTLSVSYAVAGLSLALMGMFGNQAALLMSLAFLAGLCTIGGQTAMNAATTALYPAHVRATALGAALAVGRGGSILGPWVGGLLLASNWPLTTIFGIVALPAAITAAIAFLLSRSTR